MIYKQTNKLKLSDDLFKNPSAEYRGTPFWSWNCQLEKNILLEQIDQLKEMGMGGAHIHSRTGMATEYLGDEFMQLVEDCKDKFESEDMLCWLYDEDRWPSGAAGGIVTKDIRFRARHVLWSPVEKDNFENDRMTFELLVENGDKPNGYFVAKYAILLENGCLKDYIKIAREQIVSGYDEWYVYIELSHESPWYNNQTYVNTLDKKAIDRFIEVTYERYFEKFGKDFGGVIPAIFTDEPQFTLKQSLSSPYDRSKVIMPFTDDFFDSYKKQYSSGLIEFLPELIWELPNNDVSIARYRYHDHLAERFTSAFVDNVGSWCKQHNIALTGHMMKESGLVAQTGALGEAMRNYRSFGFPGIDMLMDRREYMTAKQAQSAVHQFGYEGMLSELYGVTNWDFDFRGHKLQGDWQAALGVTTRVHHLTWVSMAGEAKRDYPASIGYQSPWYKKYNVVEDYFSRINTALTRGKASVKIGVIHPVESCWIYWGPDAQMDDKRKELDTNFQNVIDWLLHGFLDFDLISESLLPEQCSDGGTVPFKVGKGEYDILIVAECHTLRESTLERLEAFEKAGGKIVFAGQLPYLVGAQKSERAKKLAEKCGVVPLTKSKLLSAVDDVRQVDVLLNNGLRANNLVYQMRDDGDDKWLFICHSEDGKDIFADAQGKYIEADFSRDLQIIVNGDWNPMVYDAMTGHIYPCGASIENHKTYIPRRMYPQDSILICLQKGVPSQVEKQKEHQKIDIEVPDRADITLSEPNIYILDMPEYSLDNEEWHKREEILRIDKTIREKLGYQQRKSHIAQPWVEPYDTSCEHILRLRYTVDSDVIVDTPLLAMEKPESVKIFVNGNEVKPKINGWFVDKDIKSFEIPTINQGKTQIIVEMPFNKSTNLENCYILGNFGVKVEGAFAKILSPVTSLAFGDWTTQGLPFYVGNVTYHFSVMAVMGELQVQAPSFTNPVIEINISGDEKHTVAFAPFIANLGNVVNGQYNIEITAYGNRYNSFGQIHNKIGDKFAWYGPDSWRMDGNGFCCQYQLKPIGIEVTPKAWIRR